MSSPAVAARSGDGTTVEVKRELGT